MAEESRLTIRGEEDRDPDVSEEVWTRPRHVVSTDSLVRVHCFRKVLYNAVEGPSTRPKVLSMINESNIHELHQAKKGAYGNLNFL